MASAPRETGAKFRKRPLTYRARGSTGMKRFIALFAFLLLPIVADPAMAIERRLFWTTGDRLAELAGRDVAQLIENQQVKFRELAFHSHQWTLVPGFHQLRD